MLFVLKHVEGPGLFYLVGDREYVVGRKNTDIVIDDDQSISRKHAIINIKNSSVMLTDCGSKYGTSHNKKKMAGNADVFLTDKDVIKFGVFQSKYVFEKLPIVTTGSALLEDQKIQLKNKLDLLGGYLVTNWDKTCTHLTTYEIILTVKVLHAILDNKPIVTPEYWDKFLIHIQNSQLPPNPEDYKPPIRETLIHTIDFSVKPERKTLFKGKTFVFPTERVKKKMADLIRKAGGSSISWQRQKLSLLEVTKSKNKYVFIIDDKPEDFPSTLKDMHTNLEKLGLRTVPIQEIAMAIVFSSCEKDCNPKFARVEKVFRNHDVSTESEAYSLVPQTPSDYGDEDPSVPKKEIIIPESLEVDFMLPTPHKFTKPEDLPSTSKNIQKETTQQNVLEQPKENSNKSSKPKDSENLSRDPFISSNSIASCSKDMGVNRSNSGSLMEVVPQKRPAEEVLSSTAKRTFKQIPISMMVHQESSSESKKRKAEETFDFGRKKTAKANPFALMRKRHEVENPFAPLRLKKEPKIESNPFLEIFNTEKIPEKTVNESVVQPSSSNYVSPLNYVSVDSSSTKWISTREIEEIKKEEVDGGNEIDPESKEILDMFRNAFVVETIPEYSFRTVNPNSSFNSSSIIVDENENRKNFKKFRKVRPLRPQTTILMTSFQDNVILSDGAEENKDSDEEVRVPLRHKSSRLNFDF